MTTYARAEAAHRAGLPPDYVDQLIGLGVITPDAEDRLTVGDVRRAQMAQMLERAGISGGELAAGIQKGVLTLNFMDAPVFERFATYSNETFQQVSDRTGIAVDLLMLIREASGAATPDPSDRMREGELAVVPFIQAQQAVGFRPVSTARWLRVTGDSLRRMAETESDAWRNDIMAPAMERGETTEELGSTSSSAESQRLDETTNQALVALWHARQVQTWTGNIVGGFEQALTAAGMLSAPQQPPAICFLDITGYTRLTDERGDDAAAELARTLTSLVQRTAVEHGGRPVKWLGDGVMVYFPEARPAVAAALKMVAGVSAAGLPPAHVGIHAGPVLFQEGDYFGQTVNVAARIADYARPGEVLVTQGLVDAAGDDAARFTDIGPVELKGLGEPLHLLSAQPA